MRIYILCGFYFCLSLILKAQQESDPINLDQQITDESTNSLLSQEIREEKVKSTLNLSINEIDQATLGQLDFLNPKDRIIILDYIKKHQPIISPLEFQSLREVDLEKLEKFISIIDSKSEITSSQYHQFQFKKLTGRISQRWARDYPSDSKFDQSDTLASTYQGSKDKLFFRATISDPGFLQTGIIIEKDAGEKFWSSNSPTRVDYLSAHLFLTKPFKNVKAIALGDYRMRIGQGIIMDNSFIGASLTDPGLLVKSPDFLKPYQSLQENNMLRGAAIQLNSSQHSTMNFFYSRSKIDANLVDDDQILLSDQDQRVASILNSGLHRNANEIEDRNRLIVQYSGGTYKRDLNNGHIGVSVVNSFQNIDSKIDPTPYKVLLNEQSNQWYSSIFHQVNYHGYMFFGEIASDKDFHFSTIQGILKGLGKYADLAFIYRNFSPSFNSRLSQVFSANGKSQNEKGINGICNFHLSKEVKFNFNWNVWSTPWLRYRVDLPSQNSELAFRMSYIKKRKWTTYIQYYLRRREQNVTELNENVLRTNQNQGIRIHADIKLSSDWTWRARCEMHQFTQLKNPEYGFLVYQDFLYKSVESPVSGNFRLSFFQTESYNSRIYSFENDMLYQFSIPAFSGRGTSAYINLRTRLNYSWMLEFRYSVLYSGFDKLKENNTSHYNQELKLQLHFSFR